MQSSKIKAVRLHLTNINGLGAIRLLQSLLPSLISRDNYNLTEVFLPTSGELSLWTSFNDSTDISYYKRHLPNGISRLLESTLLGSKFDGRTPLLVFGDLPIACQAKQTVLVQTTLILPGESSGNQFANFKYVVLRWLFRRNLRYVSNFIVQTEAMKLALIKAYPGIRADIHVVPQPAPTWLISSQIKRTGFVRHSEPGLRLFYPAAPYPHKNHQILGEIDQLAKWPIAELLLTIPVKLNPNLAIPWIRCVDKLGPEAVVNSYRDADALLFLSLTESFGFPLVEAMWIGLPIICPDLPYARALCGEQAIYFDPQRLQSLRAAIDELNNRRASGWWPDWSANLAKIPRNWDEVAEAMLMIATQ